jgi:hypothetical protein
MIEEHQATGPVIAGEARFIRLGPGGIWAQRCLDRGEIQFGYPDEPHALCLAGDWEGAERRLAEKLGQAGGQTKALLNELRAFYTLGSDCLWITFKDGHLWWAFARPEVEHLGGDGGAHGVVMRRTLDGWHRTDLQGRPLAVDGLSTRLTQVGAYQRTICRVKELDYLSRKINGEEEPVLVRARAALAGALASAEEMIRLLHWADFELMVDLIFSRTGWRRVSRLGETMPDVDLIVSSRRRGRGPSCR